MPTLSPAWPLTLYYDGECPLCLREIHMFEGRNADARLELIDIADPTADTLPGLSRDEMLACLHARFQDGHTVKGIDATYWSYRAVGLGWLVKPLSWRWARPFWEWAYRQFCRLRPALARIVPMPGGTAAPSCESDRCEPRKKSR